MWCAAPSFRVTPLHHRVCTALKDVFEAEGKSADFPKMFNTLKYPQAILRLGSVNHANTAGREAVIKPVRTCWERTNKNPATLGQQVTKQLQVSESLGAASKQQAGAQPLHKQLHGVVSTGLACCTPCQGHLLDHVLVRMCCVCCLLLAKRAYLREHFSVRVLTCRTLFCTSDTAMAAFVLLYHTEHALGPLVHPCAL